jgi:hypothetical protein
MVMVFREYSRGCDVLYSRIFDFADKTAEKRFEKIMRN